MKIKQHTLILIILTTLVFLIAGCSGDSSNNSSGDEGDKITLKVANYLPATAPYSTEGVEAWMERAEELTEGKVEFDYYPGEQLGKSTDHYQLVKDGVADISFFVPAYNSDLFPLADMLSGIPLLSTSAYSGTMAFKDLLDEEESSAHQEFIKNGIRPIFANVTPSYEFWSVKNEIRVPEDMKGMKVRVPGGPISDAIEFMGGIPTTVPSNETFEALDKGIVDSTLNHPLAAKTYGVDEVADFGSNFNYNANILPLAINEDVFQGLPDDVKDGIMQAGEEVNIELAEWQDEASGKMAEEFSDKFTITESTKEELDEWEKVNKEFKEQWIKEQESKDIPYRETLDKYEDYNKKHE